MLWRCTWSRGKCENSGLNATRVLDSKFGSFAHLVCEQITYLCISFYEAYLSSKFKVYKNSEKEHIKG